MKNKLRIKYNSPVILSFVLMCFAVTILGMATHDRSTSLIFSTYGFSIKKPLTYVKLFSHVLGHIGFEHFIGNAMYLLLLGPMLEEKYGSVIMAEIILITAFVTGIIHCFFAADTSLCGASGIVFACIVMSSFTAFKEDEIPLTFILVVLLFIGQEIYNWIALRDNISNFSHIIGGVVGSISGYKLNHNK